MRCFIVTVALSLGALGGCTCFEPVDEASLLDAGGLSDASPAVRDAGLSPDASADPRGDGGAASDAGDASFCSGGEARVQVGGQSLPVSTTGSLVFMDCCEAAEVLFHTSEALGDLADLMLTSQVTGSGGFPSGDVAIGMDPNQAVSATLTVGASYYGSGMSAAGNRIAGTLSFSQASPSGALDLGICLTLEDRGGMHDGVRLWAPAARVMAYDWQRRFALYLLADPAVDAGAAAKLDLDALALAQEPLLDLYSIRYYRRGDHSLFYTLDMTAARLRTTLGAIPLAGKPFVVVADGARIYLGAFWTPISSMSPTTPFVMLDSSDARGFTIEAAPGSDPRGDGRAMSALEQSGKLAP